MRQLRIRRPDDWHLHLRDGDVLPDLVGHTARVFGRALVMPNLRPPVRTVEDALRYRERILDAVPASEFEPLMTLYLTPETTTADVEAAAKCPHVHAIKLYPAGATTNAEAGVSELGGIRPVLEAMQETGLPLCVHGESIDPTVDVFDREAVFIEQSLAPLLDALPELRVVLEHITTAQAVAFVEQAPQGVVATTTAHHLLLSRNAMFEGGIRPHHYCLPVLKRERHRVALLEAATSGNAKFFLGTDSAPHARATKEVACGCAGIFTAHAALPLYAEAFASVGALDRLEAFASQYGADFYGLPHNEDFVTLVKDPWKVPDRYPMGDAELVPMRAGAEVGWRVIGSGADEVE
jgi:dihydroorotase